MDQVDFSKYLPLGIGLLGIILVGVGIIVPKLKTEEPAITVEKGDGISGQARNDTKYITVDVEGAVEKPGVYQLPNDSRIVDALIPAGGLNAKADRNYISKVINMAQKLSDGSKIYFPFSGETNGPSQANLSNLINLNTATLAELDSLPGVGTVTAQKIIGGRPYQNVSELVSKKVLGSGIFNSIKDRLSVY